MPRIPNLLGLILTTAAVIVVIAIVVSLWGTLGTSDISGAGWAAMILGIVATLALGIGLMALVFISSRRGYDELDRRR